MDPLELLHEADGLEPFDLPDELRALYGGPFGLKKPSLYTNFVATLDGVVAIRSEPQSNRLISGGSEADRFVMGLLRACADMVVIGSGTLRASPKSIWTAERAYPPAADAFAELRSRLGLSPQPGLAVLTAGGSLAPEHPALEVGALVLTTEQGAARIGRRLPGAATVVSLGDGPTIDLEAAVRLLRSRGHESILSEGGPHVFGSLLAAGLADELFLTLSPLLAGRGEPGDRLALVEGQELLPGDPGSRRLLGIRRHCNHLFLRYALAAG